MSDRESLSSHSKSLRNELTAPPTPVPASLSPAICLDPHKKNKARPESTATILSELEIFDSPPTYAFTNATTPTSDEPSSDNQKEDDDGDDDPSQSSTRTSISPPTTPRQYGIGRQVLSGSGSGRDFDFIGSSSKRLSASAKRDSTGIERKESHLSFGPEPALDSNAEKTGNVEQQLDKPSAAEESSDVNQDPTQFQTRTQVPTPTTPRRRRVKSDDTNPNTGADISRQTTYHEKYQERSHPEWTLFLGIPRNAFPPPTPTPPASLLFSTGEPNALPTLASTTSMPTITHRRSLLATPFLSPTMTMRSRTRSDSALLASASAFAPAPGVAEEHDDGKSKIAETKREEDWTLSLPLVVSPTTPSSASSAEVLRGSKQHPDVPSGSVFGPQPVIVEEERQSRVREVDASQNLVITVEDVDKRKRKHHQGQVPVRRSEENERKEEKEKNQDPLILRVPRIVRSCSSHPILSMTPTSPTHNIHSRLKKSSSAKWMEIGSTSTSSTPNLRRGVSSCTLGEEVMSMLLGDSAEVEEEDSNESKSKSSSSLSTTTTTAKKDLEKKKMATLDEDLARFNALLKNGSPSGTGNRPVSSITEDAAAATAATATPTTTKNKSVTLDDHPEPIPTTPTITTTNSTSISPPLLQKKKKSTSPTTTILKPALKHVKSCVPFHLLEISYSDGGSSSSPSSMGPVMRFPSSAGREDLNFFDELGRGGSHGHGGTSRSSLRLTKSAEWIMGDDDHRALGLSAPPPPVPKITSKSRPTSSSSRASQQQRTSTTSTTSASSRASQQQRTTTTMSRPTSLSSLASQQQQRTTSRSNSALSTSTTQTPLILPFAHYNTKFASTSSSSSNLKSKGSLGRFEMSGRRRGVPTMPFRAVSMG
jgi:hypothetical protein